MNKFRKMVDRILKDHGREILYLCICAWGGFMIGLVLQLFLNHIK